MRLRVKIISFFLLFSCLFLLVKLFFWQVIRGKDLANQARLQHSSGKMVNSRRGNIFAADGSLLVSPQDSWLIYANKPDLKKSFKELATQLADYLANGDEQQVKKDQIVKIENLLNKKESIWIPIKHKLDVNTKREIESLNLEGIGFQEEEKRFYPEASSSAHLLGFVGKNSEGEDIGYFGLEGYYDLTLRGKKGYSENETDALGIPILIGRSREISAVEGIDLWTTIDKTIQLIIEKRLKEGIDRYGADRGTIIVEEPKTGRILAMASYPAYDPDKYYDFSNDYFRNPAISETFEPGSIFKPLVMVAGLDAGVINPDTKCEICSGPVKVDKYLIETWDKKYRENSTVTDIIVHSDNVGMTFVGQRLGTDKLYEYLDKLGIGKLTGIDLQGEVSQPLRKKGSWNVVDLATATFGQGVAVTPIQMTNAIATIANQGKKPNPHLVKKISKGNWEKNLESLSENQVISKEAAEKITEMMVLAVKNGESKWASAKGFSIAGKTGTAQIPVSGHYDSEKTIASFVGFSPAEEPKFVMLVTLKEPKTSPWGSETAAPLWFSIARDLFPYLGIYPEN